MPIPRARNYDLSAFAHHKIIENTSETAVKLVSGFVSGMPSPSCH